MIGRNNWYSPLFLHLSANLIPIILSLFGLWCFRTKYNPLENKPECFVRGFEKMSEKNYTILYVLHVFYLMMNNLVTPQFRNLWFKQFQLWNWDFLKWCPFTSGRSVCHRQTVKSFSVTLRLLFFLDNSSWYVHKAGEQQFSKRGRIKAVNRSCILNRRRRRRRRLRR